MAKNDRILIDAIVEERVNNCFPSNKLDVVFEYLVYEQVLKEYDLSQEEIMSGSVDGKDDGGIDAIYIFVNGNLISDLKSMLLPKSDAYLDVYIITCKHRDSFKQDPINSLLSSLEELLDFSKNSTELDGKYNDEVLNKRSTIYDAYRRTASILEGFSIYILFATRGDTKKELAENVYARGKQAETLCKEYFSNCNALFQFWGAEELLKTYRKKLRTR